MNTADEAAVNVDGGRRISAPDRYRSDLEIGDVLVSPGRTVTETHLVDWAGLTADIVSFHVDAAEAAGTQFGERIAHGPLTLSLGLGLMTMTGYFKHTIAWLGLNNVRAVKPVFIGDTIHVEAKVVESRQSSKPDRGIWSLDYQVINQKGETVMTFESSFMVRENPQH